MKNLFSTLTLISFALLTPTSSALASDNDGGVAEYFITATRVNTPTKQVASSVTVITEDELKKQQTSSVVDALKGTPGLDIVQSGGAGGNTAVFLRGSNAGHTLVLIDGVEANNPISPSREFNFGDLTVDNIERIEILRGAQSTLYGSDAIGGVIQIFTKKGKGAPSLSVSSEAGSFDTYTQKLNSSGGFENGNYSFSFTRIDSGSISAAGKKYGNSEDDGYANTSFSSRIGITPTEDLEISLIARYHDARTDLDNSGGIGGDDPNRLFENRQFFSRAEASFPTFEGLLDQTLGISLTDHEQQDDNDPDLAHPGEIQRSKFDGSLTKLDWQGSLDAGEAHDLVFGLSWLEEKGSSHFFSDGLFGPFEANIDQRKTDTLGYYFQDQLSLANSFYLTSGIRVDDHSDLDPKVTWRAAPTFSLDKTGTKIKATIGTGYKAPTLSQLYSSYGNPNLKPEKSLSIDGGVEQSLLAEQMTVGLTYFYNEFDELINFDPNTFVMENIDEAKTQGVEAFAAFDVSDNLILRSAYTYTDTEDKSTGEKLLRRAEHKFALTADYGFCENGNLTLNIQYVGERDDQNFSAYPAERLILDGYTLVNLYGSYNLTEKLRFFARVENLFDEDYEEVFGYGTKGIAGYGGFTLSI